MIRKHTLQAYANYENMLFSICIMETTTTTTSQVTHLYDTKNQVRPLRDGSL